MRKILLAISFLAIFNTAFAQSKLDLRSMMELAKLRKTTVLTDNGHTRSLGQQTKPTHIIAIVELGEEYSRADLDTQGVTVLNARDNLAIVRIPLEDVERIAELSCIRRIELPRRLQQKMNLVRQEVGIDKTHSGLNLPKAYTGKGVVTAVVDAGVDPNHINFLKEDGTSRFAYVGKIVSDDNNWKGYQYDKYYPRAILDTMTLLDNAHALEDFTTDNDEGVHGTHTLGIMAGGYKGNITYAENTKRGVINKRGQNPFYGIATESELIASCGDLLNSYILLGIEDAIKYAKTSGSEPKPCVINLSLGGNIGLHDSTSIENKYMSKLGKEAIICISAGNEGDKSIVLKRHFAHKDEVVKTFLESTESDPMTDGTTTYYNIREAQIAAYSKDSTAFEFSINIVDTQHSNKKILSLAVRNSTSGGQLIYASDKKYVTNIKSVNQEFAKYFDGYVSVSSQRDYITGIYNALADIMVGDNQINNKTGRYKLTLEIRSKKDDQSVEVYAEDKSIQFDDNNQLGYVKGTTDGTINDMACATNIVSVGSYNVRNNFASLDGNLYGFNNDFEIGHISSFSSYGTIRDGRKLPHVCAPGATIISSVNTYAVENKDNNYEDKLLQGRLKRNNHTYYWHQSMGTSMASPVVAGGIALWLEANPKLTINDVLRIIQQTARKDNFVKTTGNPIQWGAGKFDAYEGLKQVLNEMQSNGINGIRSAENKNTPIITLTGERAFNVYLTGADKLNVRAYTPSGQLVHTLSTQGDEMNINASTWEKGIYLIQVNGHKAQRIVIY